MNSHFQTENVGEQAGVEGNGKDVPSREVYPAEFPDS